ncbi:hypothetical protein BH09BAC1_BH09BAC1_30710 [soil metagenome]
MAHLPFAVSYAWGGYLGYGLNDKTIFPGLLTQIPIIGNKLLQAMWVKTIKKHDIKLVLAEYGPVGVHWLPVCKKAGIPLLIYFHGFDATRGDVLKQYQLKYKELFEYASTIFVVSKPMKKLLLEWGAPEQKLVLNPCGADLLLFNYHQRTQTTPIILSIGRFAKTKRPDLVISAFAEVLKVVPTAILRMAGAGEMLADCKRLTSQLGISQSVTFLGVLAPEQVGQEMSAAQVFVQHSMTTLDGETEGAPVAIMEAGASGLPVVSTLHAGIPEIVEHEKTGYLVSEGDIQGMAKYLIKLLQHKHIASEMGRAASERIAKHFSLEQNIRILTERIQKAL